MYVDNCTALVALVLTNNWLRHLLKHQVNLYLDGWQYMPALLVWRPGISMVPAIYLAIHLRLSVTIHQYKDGWVKQLKAVKNQPVKEEYTPISYKCVKVWNLSSSLLPLLFPPPTHPNHLCKWPLQEGYGATILKEKTEEESCIGCHLQSWSSKYILWLNSGRSWREKLAACSCCAVQVHNTCTKLGYG